MNRCRTHVDPRQWKDEPPKGGRIRTVCRICGWFVGFRPVVRDKDKTKTIEQTA